jgi:integrase/recombinase XerD
VRAFSKDTVRGRRVMLRRFIAWCAERGVDDPRAITRAVLERYQATLYHYRKADGAPLGVHTQLQCLLAIRGWFRWLTREHHIAANPAADLDLPRTTRQLPRVILSVAEVQTLLAQADPNSPELPPEHHAQALRDRAVLEVLYATGLRRRELASAALYDADLGRALLLVREGKGRRDRVVPLGARALAWLRRYLEEARPALLSGTAALLERAAGRGGPGQALFVTDYGEPISPEWLATKVRRYLGFAGITKPGATHLLRHACATHMLEGGADIRYIQALLGHADVSSTQIYTHVAIDKLAAVHAATHPGARLELPTRATRDEAQDQAALLDVLAEDEAQDEVDDEEDDEDGEPVDRL